MSARDGPTAHRLDRQYVFLVILLFGSISVIVGSYFRAYVLRELNPSIHFLVFLEAVSTITTALFIWATVHEGRNARQTMVYESERGRKAQREEYDKERKKERLREQLEFYTPIVGLVRHKNYDVGNFYLVLYDLLEDMNLDYELHAEPETKRILMEHYRERTLLDAESELLEEFRTAVLNEFGILRKAYLSLMLGNDASN